MSQRFLSSHQGDDWRSDLQAEHSALQSQMAACLLNVAGVMLTTIVVVLLSLKNGLELSPAVHRLNTVGVGFTFGSALGLVSLLLGCLSISLGDQNVSSDGSLPRQQNWWHGSFVLMILSSIWFVLSLAYFLLPVWDYFSLVIRG